MQIAAKYADIWESSYITPEQFASLNKKFDEIHKQFNNDNDGGKNISKKIGKSIELDVIIADSDSDLEYKKRIFAMERGPGVAHQILKCLFLKACLVNIIHFICKFLFCIIPNLR